MRLTVLSPASWRRVAGGLAARLTRVTTSGPFIPAVDGLRFLAITPVVLHHLMSFYLMESRRLGPVSLPADWDRVSQASPIAFILSRGFYGVPLFFAISGFVLALPFARARRGLGPAPSLRAYYLRRIRRIEPPYLISLAVCFMTIWLINPGHSLFVPHLGASLLYGHTLVYGDYSWINGVTWSLEVEAQFYLLMPVLACLFAVRSTLARRVSFGLLILGTSALARFVVEPLHLFRLSYSLAGYLHYFLAGFLLADLYLSWGERERRVTPWGDALAFAGAVLFGVAVMRPSASALVVTLPFAVVLLCSGVLRGRIAGVVMTSRPIVLVGGMCYTIYLYHVLLITLLLPLTMRLSSTAYPLWADFALQASMHCALIVMVCGLLYVLTERPFMGPSRWLAFRMVTPTRRPSGPSVPAAGRATDVVLG